VVNRAPRTSAARYFSYEGLTARVTCADRSHLTWLEEFLTPAFGIASDGVAEYAVVVDIDDRAYDEMRRHGPHPNGDCIDGFVLDNSVVRLPLWTGTHLDCVLCYDEDRVFYAIASDRAQVRLVARTGDRQARIPLMRVIREFAMAAAQARGRLILHSAALTLAGTGVIIAGPKHAGKTTLLTYLLQHPGARYVSNDRVVVDLTTPTPTIHAMPTLLTLRPATWTLFPHLRDRLLQRRYEHRRTLGETPVDGAQPFKLPLDRSFSLTPAQYVALLDVESAAAASFDVVLFPEITETGRGLVVRPLSHAATTERLVGALFGAGSAGALSEVFALPAHRARSTREHQEALCAVLAPQIRGFVCQMGRGAYDGTFPLDTITPSHL
jgi:hypothetical protein